MPSIATNAAIAAVKLAQHKAKLRQQLRASRRAIGHTERNRCKRRAARRLKQIAGLGRSKRIASYLALDEEFPSDAINTSLMRSGKQLYLPVILANGELAFSRYQRRQQLKRNQHGIYEATRRQANQHYAASEMDVILLPLVGFSPSGERLGMGGGYYDRALALPRYKNRPLLIGLGYECQRRNALPCEPWDQKLDKVLSDTTLYHCKGHR